MSQIEIDAIRRYFGFSISEAKAYAIEASAETIREITKGYEDNFLKGFYED